MSGYHELIEPPSINQMIAQWLASHNIEAFTVFAYLFFCLIIFFIATYLKERKAPVAKLVNASDR